MNDNVGERLGVGPPSDSWDQHVGICSISARRAAALPPDHALSSQRNASTEKRKYQSL